jgi:hypothetical protein
MLPKLVVCVRCGFPRTVRLGTRRVCFQCRYNWPAQATVAAVPANEALVEQLDGYAFTLEELARLKIYRLAVQARFFSDAL